MTTTVNKKKLLERPLLASMVVPLAIVLVSALIIFGVMRMLSSERNHRDLIAEMHSKTFGNRWVAAYELSKILAQSKIPAEDTLWVIQNLSQIYNETPDPRTRNFIIMALSTFKDEAILPTLEKGLLDESQEVKFNAIVALSNLPAGNTFNFEKLFPLLNSSDAGIQQATVLTLTKQKITGSVELIRNLLKSSDISVRFASASALIDFRILDAEILSEILRLNADGEAKKFFNASQIEALKLNVLSALVRNDVAKTKLMFEEIQKVALTDKNLRVKTKAQEILNLLKN